MSTTEPVTPHFLTISGEKQALRRAQFILSSEINHLFKRLFFTIICKWAEILVSRGVTWSEMNPTFPVWALWSIPHAIYCIICYLQCSMSDLGVHLPKPMSKPDLNPTENYNGFFHTTTSLFIAMACAFLHTILSVRDLWVFKGCF